MRISEKKRQKAKKNNKNKMQEYLKNLYGEETYNKLIECLNILKEGIK